LVQAADRKIHVGSRAVAKMIEKYQPLLGLHGHIHESRGAQKIRKTTIINPGSEYSEGILKGVVLVLERCKVKDYIFTSG
jgi:Icc-related predicted phosphoesterase